MPHTSKLPHMGTTIFTVMSKLVADHKAINLSQMMDYSAISKERDVDFARRLTTRHGVAAIPPSVFYHDHKDLTVVRFCFAKEDRTLTQAAERLCRI